MTQLTPELEEKVRSYMESMNERLDSLLEPTIKDVNDVIYINGEKAEFPKNADYQNLLQKYSLQMKEQNQKIDKATRELKAIEDKISSINEKLSQLPEKLDYETAKTKQELLFERNQLNKDKELAESTLSAVSITDENEIINSLKI